MMTIYDQLKKYLETLSLSNSISDELWEKMKTSSKPIIIKKEEVLVQSGSVNKYAYFVASGSLLTSIVTENGENKAVWFHFDDYFNMAICPDSYFLDQPTQYEIRAMANATLIRFHKQKVDGWAKEYPTFNQLYFRDITTIATAMQELRSYHLSHTSVQFLSYLKEKYPIFVERLSSKYMAHFLGVSPEWYSKLKKK